MRLSLAVAYLLGTAITFLHGLEAGERRCAECEAGPAFTAACDGAGCPSSGHHHHSSGLPSHEHAGCGICQKHFSTAASSPLGFAPASDAASTHGASPRSALPGAPTFARPPTRAPPGN